MRWKRQPFLTWADCVAPGLLVMQAVARWGNFFNQELYGPPTDLPWGIPIQCVNRTATWACPPLGTTPVDTHFHPLFLYESISGAVGAIVLLLVARRVRWLRPGDITLLFFVWYGTTRFLLEPLRSNNWTVGGLADGLDHQRVVRPRSAGDPRLAPPARSPRWGRGTAAGRGVAPGRRRPPAAPE